MSMTNTEFNHFLACAPNHSLEEYLEALYDAVDAVEAGEETHTMLKRIAEIEIAMAERG